MWSRWTFQSAISHFRARQFNERHRRNWPPLTSLPRADRFYWEKLLLLIRGLHGITRMSSHDPVWKGRKILVRFADVYPICAVHGNEKQFAICSSDRSRAQKPRVIGTKNHMVDLNLRLELLSCQSCIFTWHKCWLLSSKSRFCSCEDMQSIAQYLKTNNWTRRNGSNTARYIYCMIISRIFKSSSCTQDTYQYHFRGQLRKSEIKKNTTRGDLKI